MFQSTSQNNIDICSLVPSTLYIFINRFSPCKTPKPFLRQSRSRHDIDFIQITAGKWKRTVDPFAEVTPEAREKAQEEPRRWVRGWSLVGGV